MNAFPKQRTPLLTRLMNRTLIAAAFLALIFSPALVHAQGTPVKIILDTDIGGDVDDAGALAVLNKLADAGECEILACVFSAVISDKSAAAAIDAINTYYGRPGIPIGTFQEKPYFGIYGGNYSTKLRDEFPHTALADDKQPNSLDVYRKTLAAAPDNSVKIVSINLEVLLKSKADSQSPLSGPDLIKKKVKQLVVMGGKYPAGMEWNFSGQGACGAHTRYVVENWPTPILFSGFEIGQGIVTGTKLGSAPKNDPVRRAYEVFNNFAGRSSWDLTAVLAAVRDPELYWTVVKDGYCNVAPADGSNQWTPTPHRGHSYLVTKVPQADLAVLLDNFMAMPPGRQK